MDAVPMTGHPVVDSVIAVTVGVGLGLASLGCGLWALWAKAAPLLKRIEGFAKTSADQTANSHAGAEYPNLRDNLDAILAEVRVQGDAQREMKKDIGGLRSELRADREAQRETARALAEHIRDKQLIEPRLATVERELRTHRKKTETP